MSSEKCSLRFEDPGSPDASQIAEFLFLFRGIYAAAVNLIEIHDVATAQSAEALASPSPSSSAQSAEALASPSPSSSSAQSAEELASRLEKRLASLSIKQLDRLFYQDLGDSQLVTRRVSYGSPLEIVFEGIVVALVVAVILSGGRVKVLGVVEAELSSLGDGISKLRLALAPGTKARTAYGVRPRKVKLSREEIADLFHLNRIQRDRGGFQRFLVSLQDRINRQTGVLELSGADIDFILRHGRQARKGGFQAIIRKIFQRHFYFDDA